MAYPIMIKITVDDAVEVSDEEMRELAVAASRAMDEIIARRGG